MSKICNHDQYIFFNYLVDPMQVTSVIIDKDKCERLMLSNRIPASVSLFSQLQITDNVTCKNK